MKICVACSAGGHLTEIAQLDNVYKKHEHFFLTFRRRDSEDLAKNERVYFVRDTARSALNAAVNAVQSLHIMLKERPDMVISTGAGVAVAACYLAKLMRKKVVFIESFCRVGGPSLSGRAVHPIADLFIVQWRPMLKHYPKAVYGGTVF